MDDLIPLPLAALHEELGAKLVPFAGYLMPVQYPAGVMAEHLHVRAAAGLFDVSHMGQVIVWGEGRARALERLMPQAVEGLAKGRQRYGFLTTDAGGVADDLIVANRGDHLLLVVNGATKHADLERMRAGMPDCAVDLLEDRALLAVQGPAAEDALAAIVPGAAGLAFMDVATLPWEGHDLWVSRSGYTGEDGFEISVPLAGAEDLARALLRGPDVRPIGLGARDSLRLEAGLPLYGQDLSEIVSPVEAGLGWAIQKPRRAGGAREGGFPGAARILRELEHGAPRRRSGLRPEGRAPMRAGVRLFESEGGAEPVGEITSGGFGPSVGGAVAMGLIRANIPAGARLWGELRGRRQPVAVTDLPFTEPRNRRR